MENIVYNIFSHTIGKLDLSVYMKFDLNDSPYKLVTSHLKCDPVSAKAQNLSYNQNDTFYIILQI